MESEEELDLFEMFALLRKHLVFLIVLTVLSGTAVFVFAMFMPNEYTASTTMYVLSRNETEQAASVTQQDLSVGQMLTNDVSTLIESSRVKRDVAQKVGLGSIGDYKFKISSSNTTRVITLSVTGKDPEMAARIANATVEEVSSVANEVMQIQSVNVIDSATTPTSPSGPKRIFYTAIGAAAGLVLAIVIVLLRDSLDTRIRSGEDAEAIVGVPVVGHFPAIE